MPSSTAKIFSEDAKRYDEAFSHTGVGKAQREKVYTHLVKSVSLGGISKVLEINCGTGEDIAFFLNHGKEVIASDIAQGMVDIAQEKNPEVSIDCLDGIRAVETYRREENYLLFSNFGGLNCLSPNELQGLIQRASAKQKSGDKLAFVIMPKRCFMENVYFLFTGKWSKMNRRNTGDALAVNVNGEMVNTWFYRPEEIAHYLKMADYQVSYYKPVAFFVPPSYLSNKFKEGGFLLRLAKTFDRLATKLSVLSGRADHFIICATRK